MFLVHTPPRKRDTKAALRLSEWSMIASLPLLQMAADVALSKAGRVVDDIPGRHA